MISMSNIYNIVVNPVSGFIHPFGKPTSEMSQSGIVQAEEGQSITFNIIGATDGELQDVLVDGSSVGLVNSYTFENVNSDHSIAAYFSY